jgi:GT2 family glycosyltransferase
LVIDNASSDKTVEIVRKRGVEVISNNHNLGFAAGVNQGFKKTSTSHVLLLNPDVELQSPAAELERYALAAGQLTSGNGAPQQGFTIRRFPTPLSLTLEVLGINRLWSRNSVNRRYRYLDRDLSQPGEVEQPAGAFLMIRRDVWETLGGFDESFKPVWFEDVDFCRRAALAGFRAQYFPSIRARHAGGNSVAQVSKGCRERYWYGSLLGYAAKHFGWFGYRGVCAAVVLGAAPRMVAGMIRERGFTPFTDFCRIAGLATLGLFSARFVRSANVGEIKKEQ